MGIGLGDGTGAGGKGSGCGAGTGAGGRGSGCGEGGGLIGCGGSGSTAERSTGITIDGHHPKVIMIAISAILLIPFIELCSD